MKKTLLAIHLPYRSRAVYYRPYLERAGKSTVIDWAANRLAQICDTAVVHHGGADGGYFASRPAEKYQVVECDTPSKLDALVKAAEGVDTVVCCGPEAAFAALQTFEQALAVHRNT